jgi:hypothetical protein
LRAAIAQHDTYISEEVMYKLIEKITPREAVCLAVRQIREFLPAFEQYHPDMTAPRIMLDLMAEGEPIDPERPFPELDNRRFTPGYDGFLLALELVDAAALHQTDPPACYRKAGRAIANALGTRRLEYWARRFPEDWEIARRSELGEENLPPLKSAYLREPVVEQFTVDIWTALADELETLLPA